MQTRFTTAALPFCRRIVVGDWEGDCDCDGEGDSEGEGDCGILTSLAAIARIPLSVAVAVTTLLLREEV